MKLGIVGLPNVGKSTLLNLFAGKNIASAANYPFCTIEPNVYMAPLRDERLESLAKISNSEKIEFSYIKVIDIAGLVKGASEGSGMGNKFLGHIREVDGIIHLIRSFKNDEIMHVEGRINPNEDKEIIKLELFNADLEKVDKKKFQDLYNTLSRFEIPKSIPEGFSTPLIVTKPCVYVVNCDQEDIDKKIIDEDNYVNICISSDSSIGINKIIEESFKALNLITFFTVGKKEAKAWKLKKGSTVQEAAGCIHSDIQRGFIAAEVRVNLNDKPKIVKKDYIVQDGDILFFRFNV